jgi:hypothetical protein
LDLQTQKVVTHEKGLQKEGNLVLVKGDISKRNGKLFSISVWYIHIRKRDNKSFN